VWPVAVLGSGEEPAQPIPEGLRWNPGWNQSSAVSDLDQFTVLNASGIGKWVKVHVLLRREVGNDGVSVHVRQSRMHRGFPCPREISEIEGFP
jgi:hypothetical protein